MGRDGVWWDLIMVQSSGNVSRVHAERLGVLLRVVRGRAEPMEELMVPPCVPPSPVVWYSKAACVVVSMWSEMFLMKPWVTALLQRSSMRP